LVFAIWARHVEEVIDFIDRHPQAIVTGFNIAGDERAGAFADFAPLLPRLKERRLGRSYHAGEICDADSVQQAIDCGAMRIGHGVRAINDAATVQRLIEQSITLEVSITSNCLLVEPYRRDPAAHPVRKLYDAGVRISLNTDDAGIFGTDIAKEYRLAAQMFGFGRAELLDVSLCAVEAAFIGEDIKQSLIDRVYRAFEPDDIIELERSAEHAVSPALKQRLHQRLAQLAALPNASINTP
jgi:adenosine deaminase